ncbi:hypothetical protein [Streptomyces longwoodensis]|uniref:hypothetical protein n=1 Tax=Streptomyces longwoodensis TaxID=68231 RepID=UPI003407CFF4
MLLALVTAHVAWVWAVERVSASSVADAETDSEAAPDEEADALARSYRANKPRGRTGSTTLRVVPARGSDSARWLATAKHKLALGAGDPMTKDLRRDLVDLDEWLPFELFVGGDGCLRDDFDTYFDDDRLEQGGPSATVYAFDTSDETWAGTGIDCPDGVATVLYADVKKGWLGKSGLYNRWTLTIDTSRRPIIAIDGATALSQSAHSVKLQLPASGLVSVMLGTDASKPGDVEELADTAQNYRSIKLEAGTLLAAVAAVTYCWALPFVRRWAPTATRARWTAATVVTGVLTAATLVYALAAPGEIGARWWAYEGSSAPLVAWWWVLLPFLLGAFVIRAATGRPPQVMQLLPLSLVPGAVPLIAAFVFAVTGRTAAPVLSIGVAVALAALSALLLKHGTAGLAGRRWAATAAMGLWLVALAVGPGTGLPYDVAGAWRLDNVVSDALSWSWAALLWPVLRTFAWRRWSAAALVGVVWYFGALFDDAYYSWSQQEDGSWTSLGVATDAAANQPLLTMQTVLVCGALLYLSRHVGSGSGKWPPHVRTVVMGLGIAAAATAVTRFNFVSFGDDDVQRSGRYLAVAIAAVGFALLLPQSAERRAARLHAVPSRAHNRRMHALLKDQTMEASRREFLTSSRAALAAGELTAREWSARWKKLGALGARSTAPQHSLALRLAALGSSGGRSAWRNGVAGAVLLTVLSLPWLFYTLPPLLSVTSQVDSSVEVWTYALRWSLYGFIYGYAYSWVRGGSPLGKAMCLLAVVLTAELAQLLYRGLKPDAFGISLLLTAGNCLAVFLVLGLYWEARMVRAAGLRWGQIRSFRSLSTIAVPASTVVVAAATALATAMVGVWVAPGSSPTAENPRDQPSATAPRDPGP